MVDKAMNTLNNLLRPANVTKQLPPRISDVDEDSRACFPLGFGHSSSYISNGVVLVG